MSNLEQNSNFEYLTGEEGHGRAVDPGVVPRRGHSLQVVLALCRRDPGTSQLTVIDYDLVSLHGLFHGNQGIWNKGATRPTSQLSLCN